MKSRSTSTVRRPSPLKKLSIGDETIHCTLGHPFWVDGTGWVMAKELAAGQYLHGRSGAVPLWEVEAGATAKAYNLVVADFNSYFVGRECVLVHDNSIPEPAESLVPGMAQVLQNAKRD